MAVNYNDDRFQQVEDEKQEQLNQYNQTYDDLMAEREEITNQQQGLVDQWQQTQNENLDKQLQFQQDLINQQKAETEKAYQKEAKSAYTDYQKEIDRYGVSREQQVTNGVGNTGYSESSNVSMYNTYQNRLSTAHESLTKAYTEFDNAIREAQLTNDVTKAENALTALQQKLQITLEGFNYKDTATQNKLNWQQQINSDYYNRYQDVLNQINYENEVAEQIRQFNEQMALQKQQFEYQKQQDAIVNAQNWASISRNNSGGYSLTDGNGGTAANGRTIAANPYTGTVHPDAQYGVFEWGDNPGTGYQPNNVGGKELSKSGLTVKNVFNNAYGSSGIDLSNQNIWKTSNGKYYVWDGSRNDYIDVTSQVNTSLKTNTTSRWGW